MELRIAASFAIPGWMKEERRKPYGLERGPERAQSRPEPHRHCMQLNEIVIKHAELRVKQQQTYRC